MRGRRAAAAADDARAGVDRQARVVGHQLRRAGIVDMRAMPLRDAGIGLGDDDRLRPRLASCASTETSESAAPTPQLAPNASGAASKPSISSAKAAGARPIIVLPARVEARGHGIGHAERAGGARGGADFLGRRHGLDPDDVGAALLQPLDLFDENLDRLVLGERPERREQIAGRPDRAGDDDRPPGAIGGVARDFGGERDSVRASGLRAVQHQPAAVAAETIGQDDVGAGVDEALMQRADFVRMVVVPEFRDFARGEAHLEQIGAGRAVGEQRTAFGEQGFKHRDLGEFARLNARVVVRPPREQVVK